MAAKLEWNGNAVQMGPFVLGFTESMGGRHRYVIRNGRQDKGPEPYESLLDCMQRPRVRSPPPAEGIRGGL